MTIGVNTDYANSNLNGAVSMQNYLAPANTALNNPSLSKSGSIFNFGNNPLGTVTTNNYEDDFFMPDCLKTSSMTNLPVNTVAPETATTAPVVQQNNNPQNIVQQDFEKSQQSVVNPVSTQLTTEEDLTGYLNAGDKNLEITENGNPYIKTNTGKKAGAALGFLAPVTGKLVQLFKGGKFSELFKFKQIAIACPAIALAGLGIGALIDGYVNTQRAKAADTLYKQNIAQAA